MRGFFDEKSGPIGAPTTLRPSVGYGPTKEDRRDQLVAETAKLLAAILGIMRAWIVLAVGVPAFLFGFWIHAWAFVAYRVFGGRGKPPEFDAVAAVASGLGLAGVSLGVWWGLSRAFEHSALHRVRRLMSRDLE